MTWLPASETLGWPSSLDLGRWSETPMDRFANQHFNLKKSHCPSHCLFSEIHWFTPFKVGTRRYMAPEVLEGAINFSRDAFLRLFKTLNV